VIVAVGVLGVGVSEAVAVGVLVGNGVDVGVRVLVGVEVGLTVGVKVGVDVLRSSPIRLGMLQAAIKIPSHKEISIPVLTHFGWKFAQ
jgi:hypothetical protein